MPPTFFLVLTMGAWLMKFELAADLGVEGALEELVFRQPDGAFIVHLENHRMEPGCESPSLNAYFLFQADDLDDAEVRGEKHCGRFLDFLAFATSARFRVGRRICLFDWSADAEWRHGYIYKSFPNPDLPQLVLDPKIASTIELLLAADAKGDLSQAVHWFSAGTSADTPEEQFQLFWFSIETIARCSRDKAKVPDRCAVCREPLYCSRCKEIPTHRPYQSQEIRRLFSRHIADGADELYRMTSSMRHALLHGDRVGRVEAKFGRTLSQLVDIVGKVAWVALLEGLVPSLRQEGAARETFIQPSTFVHYHMAAKVHVAFESPSGRAPVFADIPTGIDASLIVRDQPPDQSPGNS